MSRARITAIVRTLAGLALLALALHAVDVRQLLERLAHLQLAWVLLGVALGPLQLALAALRWRFTAQRLGLPLGPRRALREYALSSFLNQVLPLGVLGDVARGARHARALGATSRPALAPALRAVWIERSAGQLTLGLVALAALPLWIDRASGQLAPTTPPSWTSLLACTLAGTVITFGARSRATWIAPRLHALAPLRHDLRAALLSATALPRQLGLSLLLLASIGLQVLCALRALDLQLAPAAALQIVPLMLLSSALPASIAGFGPREAATVALYTAAELPAEHGAALALTCGLLALLSSCTGLAWLAVREPA